VKVEKVVELFGKWCINNVGGACGGVIGGSHGVSASWFLMEGDSVLSDRRFFPFQSLLFVNATLIVMFPVEGITPIRTTYKHNVNSTYFLLIVTLFLLRGSNLEKVISCSPLGPECDPIGRK